MNRVQQQNYLGNMQALEKNQLTIESIRQQRDQRTLSIPMAERLEAYVQGQQAPIIENHEAEVWTKHREAILNGNGSEASILADVKSGHLKWTIGDKLIGQLEAMKKNDTKPDDWWFKTALQQGKTMLGGPVDPFTQQPGETPAYFNFAFALKKKVDDEKLKGPDIQKAAQELIAPLAADKANSFMFGKPPEAPAQPGIISRAWNAVTGPGETFLYKNGQKVPVDKATYDAYIKKYGRGPGNLPGRVQGGQVDAGTDYLMGEAGPELLKERDKTVLVGQNGPEVVTPDQTGEVIPNDSNIVQKALEQYPILKKMGLQGTYTDIPGKYGGIESWPPGESGEPGYERPIDLPLDKFGVQVFKSGGVGGPLKPIDVLADAVSHHLVNDDPKLKQFYQDFKDSLTDQQKEKLQKDYERDHPEKDIPFNQYVEHDRLPAFFRGYTFNQWPEEFTSKLFNKKQIRIFDKVRDYVGIKSEKK